MNQIMIYILKYILNKGSKDNPQNNKHNAYYLVLKIKEDSTNPKQVDIVNIDWNETQIVINKKELDILVKEADKSIILNKEISNEDIKKLFSYLSFNNNENIENIDIDKILSSKTLKKQLDNKDKNGDNSFGISETNTNIEELFKPCSKRARGVLLKIFYEIN